VGSVVSLTFNFSLDSTFNAGTSFKVIFDSNFTIADYPGCATDNTLTANPSNCAMASNTYTVLDMIALQASTA
jgi:hypothetical protein